MKFPSSVLAGEVPFDGSAVAVKATVPSLDFVLQSGQMADSAFSQALTAEQADFDLGLVEPTAMLGRVMDSEAVPQQAAQFLAISLHERFAPEQAVKLAREFQAAFGRYGGFHMVDLLAKRQKYVETLD
jgi:hypothetical protein